MDVAAVAIREICHRVIYGVISPGFSVFFRLGVGGGGKKGNCVHGCLEELEMCEL